MKTTLSILISILLLNPFFITGAFAIPLEQNQHSQKSASSYQEGSIPDNEMINIDHKTHLTVEKEKRRQKQMQSRRKEHSRIHSYLERLI